MSNLLEEISNYQLQQLAAQVKRKIQDKQQDGEFCLSCKEFHRMAIKNFEQGLLCWGCNTHVNRVILNLE